MPTDAKAVIITPEAPLGAALAAALGQGQGARFEALVAPTPLDASRDRRFGDASIVLYDGVAHPAAARPLRGMFPRAALVIVAPPGHERTIESELVAGAADYLLRDDGGAYLRLLALKMARAAEAAASAGAEETAAPSSLGQILRLEESLRRSEIRFGQLVQAIPDVVYQLDPQGNIVFVNAAIANLDYGAQDLLGKHFSVLIHPEDLPYVSREHVIRKIREGSLDRGTTPKLFDERRAGDRRTRGLVVRLMTRPGGPSGAAHRLGDVVSYGVIEALGRYERDDTKPEVGQDESEAFLGTVGIIHDITLHRRSEEMIRVLLQAVDQSPVGIVILDAAGAVEYVNPLFLRESRLLPEEVIGRRASLLTETESLRALFTILGETSARGAEWRGSLPRAAPDAPAWQEMYVSPVRDPVGRTSHFIAVLTVGRAGPAEAGPGGAVGRR